ncbi:MAG: hypothetical protein IJZ61_03130 [Oscillospiraceae bacterium]|nr:hypothetical protein [Oscillospiraceae bacterium]
MVDEFIPLDISIIILYDINIDEQNFKQLPRDFSGFYFCNKSLKIVPKDF